MHPNASYEMLVNKNRALEEEVKDLKRSERSLKKRLRFEELLSSLSQTFVNLPPSQIDTEIDKALKMIVNFLDFDRSSLYRFSNDKKRLWVTHSYAAPGTAEVKPGLISDQYPWYTKKMAKGRMMVFKRVLEDTPVSATVDRATTLKDQIKSHIGVPLKVGGDVLGILGIGIYRSKRKWNDELISRLQLVGEVFANALVRKQSDESLNKAFEEIKELKNQLAADYSYLKEEIKLTHNFGHIIGQSQSVKSSLQKVEQVAVTDTTVLILGETGTGKELFARAIHDTGKRKNRPLVKVNCAALPRHLIESELFGHEKGAFTGAEKKRIGRFELANGATLFLDEIGELPLDLQAKLLRILQNGEFERLGDSKTIRTDARLIAATNRNLEEEVAKGNFRKDLWYRLNVFPILVPPLRHRKEDIPLLVHAFVQKYSKKIGKPIESIPKKTLKTLHGYSWPGNVRELENLIERAIIASQDQVLRVELPIGSNIILDGVKTLVEVERDYIIEVLNMVNWKIAGPMGAAAILDIHHNTLRSRMQKLRIRKKIVSQS